MEVSLDGGKTYGKAKLIEPNTAAAGVTLGIHLRNTQLPLEQRSTIPKGYGWEPVIPHPVNIT